MRAEVTGQVAALRIESEAQCATVSQRVVHCQDLSGALEARAQKVDSAFRSRIVRKHTSFPPGAKKVLVVEDDMATLRGLQRMLQPLVDIVHVAQSIEAAKKLAERNCYDLLIVDYKLANGFAPELIRIIRAASQNPLVWTILMSGIVSKDNGPQMAREVRANDWLAKPVEQNVLQDKVNHGLAESLAARKGI